MALGSASVVLSARACEVLAARICTTSKPPSIDRHLPSTETPEDAGNSQRCAAALLARCGGSATTRPDFDAQSCLGERPPVAFVSSTQRLLRSAVLAMRCRVAQTMRRAGCSSTSHISPAGFATTTFRAPGRLCCYHPTVRGAGRSRAVIPSGTGQPAQMPPLAL